MRKAPQEMQASPCRELLFSTDGCPVPLQTNGNSNGLVPMLRVYNNTARYVDQGGNKVPLTRVQKETSGNGRASTLGRVVP